MASVNKAIIIGNLGQDPEVKYLPSGDAVCSLSVATTDTWKDKDGNKQEATEWHRISFFGRQAEVCGQYLKKGSQIYVEGSIRTRKWKDKDGNDRYSTEIRGDKMQMLGGKSGNKPAENGNSAPPQNGNKPPESGNNSGGGFNDFEDDIPF